MPSYVMLANWTDQGWKTITDAPKRIDAAKKMLSDMGGHLHTLCMTMGEFDMVGIYDAPDDAVAARLSLLLGQLGNVRVTSMKAFPEDAYREIIKSLK
jgi:uncharacterized protein with GYD domain